MLISQASLTTYLQRTTTNSTTKAEAF